FIFYQDLLYQVIKQPYYINIVHEIISDENTPEGIIQRMASKKYDLGNGPLFDICLITGESKRCWLACCFHHIIIDASSVTIFIKNILERYECLVKQRQFHYIKTSCDYLEFTQWQKKQ
ncbi:condensation domain-containing protein, partial [Xenorhabdus bovienii]|uniref:condensation domain-containing protein n=1 Tax=Xenorhabdus bovienii TaxID=40576 RepID=UPI0023B2C3C7